MKRYFSEADLKAVEKLLLDGSGDRNPSEQLSKQFSHMLLTIDPAVMARIPGFLDGKPSGAYSVLLDLIAYKGSTDIVRGYMNHYDYLMAQHVIHPAVVGSWMEHEFLEKYALPTWKLPLEQEREVVRAIYEMQKGGTRPLRWVVKSLVAHPDKTEQIIDLMVKRDIGTRQELEALINDGLPTALIEGAL